MKPIKRKNVRRILIEVAGLSAPARQEFLDAMNAYLFASPQRRRMILDAWKVEDGQDQPASPMDA